MGEESATASCMERFGCETHLKERCNAAASFSVATSLTPD